MKMWVSSSGGRVRRDVIVFFVFFLLGFFGWM